MSNMGLLTSSLRKKVPFARAKAVTVGVMQELEKNGWTLGGEPSGHILTLDKASTHDAHCCGLR